MVTSQSDYRRRRRIRVYSITPIHHLINDIIYTPRRVLRNQHYFAPESKTNKNWKRYTWYYYGDYYTSNVLRIPRSDASRKHRYICEPKNEHNAHARFEVFQLFNETFRASGCRWPRIVVDIYIYNTV